MAKPPKIYVESCPFIDLVKHKAKVSLGDDREKNCWWLNKMLEASRNGDMEIVTSSLTVSECTHIEPGKPQPTKEVQEFFEELLTSGAGGVSLIQPVMRIVKRSRDLRWKDGLTLKCLDAMHLASALELSCEELITTDGRLISCAQTFASKLKIITAQQTTRLDQKYHPDIFSSQS
jgi:predicted nucleic acid-binding protein